MSIKDINPTFRLLGNFFLISSLLTLVTGDLPFDEVLKGAYARIFENSHEWNALLDERLPRVFILFFTGASLAVSGAVMQSLFQNPLASPTVLGISSGGSFCVILVYLFGLSELFPHLIPIAAFTGSLLTLFLVYFLSKKDGFVTMQTLILSGIAVSTVMIAFQGAILYSLKENFSLLQKLTEWEAGSTYDKTWRHVHLQAPVSLVGLFSCFYYQKDLNLFCLGEEQAISLGVDVNKLRFHLFLSIALLTGGSLSSVGNISFFGLLVPHLFRKLYGADHTLLIPLCILGGGSLLLFFDFLLRFFSLYFLSLGHFFAIFGGFFFLFLLFKEKRVQECFL